MRAAPTVVGINRSQDASLALLTGPGTAYSLQKERVTRRKHHWGRVGDVQDCYLPRLAALREPVDLVVECFSSDAEVAHRPRYHAELAEALVFRDGIKIATVSHHLAHLYSAFYPSPFSEAAVMVIDAQGSPVRDVTERFDRDGASPDAVEVASFYRCEPGRIACLGKQLWDMDWARPVGLGCFYYLLTRMIFPGEGNEGKVMGLAPFGRPQALGLPDLIVDGHQVFIPEGWMQVFRTRSDEFRFSEHPGPFQACADLAAAGQRAFEAALLGVAAWLHAESGMGALCFAGGTALNCSANGRLLRESPFSRIFIPPSPHDGGTALGCALYGRLAVLEGRSEFRWAQDFLGPEPDAGDLEAVLHSARTDLLIAEPPDLLDGMVDLLAAGHVVALHQGRSESGPRALGNRSILADPRHPRMQDFINAQVKGREMFRPLAPVVLWEAAPRIFDIDRPAPFMQFAADVRPAYRRVLPGITHVDGTARLQTVHATTTPFLHALLTRFEARTGCPVLLNTSLNGKGDPLVETAAEALACLQNTAMHALALPPYLVRKRQAAAVPRDEPTAPALALQETGVE